MRKYTYLLYIQLKKSRIGLEERKRLVGFIYLKLTISYPGVRLIICLQDGLTDNNFFSVP